MKYKDYYEILGVDKNASEAVKELMVREGKSELTVLDWN